MYSHPLPLAFADAPLPVSSTAPRLVFELDDFTSSIKCTAEGEAAGALLRLVGQRNAPSSSLERMRVKLRLENLDSLRFIVTPDRGQTLKVIHVMR